MTIASKNTIVLSISTICTMVHPHGIGCWGYLGQVDLDLQQHSREFAEGQYFLQSDKEWYECRFSDGGAGYCNKRGMLTYEESLHRWANWHADELLHLLSRFPEVGDMMIEGENFDQLKIKAAAILIRLAMDKELEHIREMEMDEDVKQCVNILWEKMRELGVPKSDWSQNPKFRESLSQMGNSGFQEEILKDCDRMLCPVTEWCK